MELCIQHQVTAALLPNKRTPRRRSKRFLEKKKSLAHAGIRNPDSSSRSHSLHRLSYPGCHKFFTDRKCAIVYFSVSQYRISFPDKVHSTNQRSVVWPTSITYTTYLSYARMSPLPPTHLQVICKCTVIFVSVTINILILLLLIAHLQNADLFITNYSLTF